MTKAVKPSQTSPQGGFLKVESSIVVSKLAVIDSKNKASKVGIKINNDGKSKRFHKSTKQEF